MKYCPFCGAGLDEDFAFCPKCGKPFEGEKENPHLAGKSVPQATPAVAAPVPPPAAEPAPKKKKRGGLIAVIAVVVMLAIVGGLFAAGAFAPKEEPVVPFSDNTEAIEQASKSVVMLTCYDKDGEPYATGSGFAVFEDGVIVNNYHVIEREAYRVKAQTEGGISFECPTVLAYDADKDIAILKADRATDLALLPVGTANGLQKGAKVVAIGSPLGLINSVSTGVFSGYMEDNAGSMLQFTAPISHGSSGGALFNDTGEVIGITFATLTEGQSLNLGVPIDDVKALYENAGSQKTMSMEAFYDTFDHTPPIPTYTVGYVLEHYKELNGQTMYVEGYVSSSWGPICLVEMEEDIIGYEIDSSKFWYDIYMEARAAWENNELPRIEAFQCISIQPTTEEMDAIDFSIQPGIKVSVLCRLKIKDKNEAGMELIGGRKLDFTFMGISLLDK